MKRGWLLVLLLAVGGCRDRRPPPAPPPPNTTGTATTADGELTAGEASRFFHEPIGSDPLPQFALAELKQPDGRRFLDDLARFGLLPDPSEEHNEERLPIGMTVYLPFDLQPFNVRFYGFTCAACHVGEVAPGDGRAPVRIIGAPGRFDPARFHRELVAAAEPLFTQLPALLAVMLSYYDEVTRASEDMTDPTGLKRVLFQSTLGPAAGDAGAPAFHDSLRRDLEAVRRAAVRLSVDEVVRQDPLLGRGADPPTAKIAASAATLRLATGKATAPTRLGELPARERIALVNGLLADTFHVLRLMRARVEHARAGGGSTPGPGRVDVLRRLSFALGVPSDKPPYAPVAAPPLWNSHQLARIHWDQNTNSIFEHGIVMAIALGAPVHPRTHASTIQPRALAATVQVLPRLRPPAPPPGADAKRVASGRVVFARECARCHEPGPTGFSPDPNAGTDPARLEAHRAVREPLARLLASVKARAYARASISADEQPSLEAGRTPARWYPSEGYAPRSLAGVWATAPYLHNDSVAGLADLLEVERPPRFKGGGRGEGNGGHPYGNALSPADKVALVAYLGSL